MSSAILGQMRICLWIFRLLLQTVRTSIQRLLTELLGQFLEFQHKAWVGDSDAGANHSALQILAYAAAKDRYY